MTIDHAAVLMNKYFDDEATDTEIQDLFRHLSESAESRSLFAGMKSVQETLARTPCVDIPRELDMKFSALAMAPESIMNRTLTMSVPSALLSGFVICLLSFVLFTMASRSLSTPLEYRQESAMNSLPFNDSPAAR